MVLINFLTFGKYHNIYEWAQWRAEKSTKSREDIIREKLGKWYDARVAFDKHFELSEQFRYGALNIGGIGVTYYGAFCTIFADRAFSDRREVAFFRSDTLRACLRAGAAMDEEVIRKGAAPYTHKHLLAGLKHANEIPRKKEEQWASMVCSDSEYVEAIFAIDVTPNDLEVIRMSRLDYELMFEYAFEEFRAELTDADRYLVDGFVMILEYVEQGGIILEVVDND